MQEQDDGRAWITLGQVQGEIGAVMNLDQVGCRLADDAGHACQVALRTAEGRPQDRCGRNEVAAGEAERAHGLADNDIALLPEPVHEQTDGADRLRREAFAWRQDRDDARVLDGRLLLVRSGYTCRFSYFGNIHSAGSASASPYHSSTRGWFRTAWQ